MFGKKKVKVKQFLFYESNDWAKVNEWIVSEAVEVARKGFEVLDTGIRMEIGDIITVRDGDVEKKTYTTRYLGVVVYQYEKEVI